VIPFVVHATPATQQLGARGIRSDATYQDAIDVYGKPSVCLPRRPWHLRGRVPLGAPLTAVLRDGRVASVVFPVGAEGD
jgi:hypothetical protein